LYELPFRHHKAFKSPTLFSKFTNMVARCFSLFSIKRSFSLKNPKFDLFGSANAGWQILLQIETA